MNAHDRLVGLNEPGDERPPRLFLARGRNSHAIWFAADLSPEAMAACESAARKLPAWDGEVPDGELYEPLRRALSAEGPLRSEEKGPAFRFGEHVDVPPVCEVRLIDETCADLLERHFPYTRSELAWRAPVIGAIVDGWVVAACYSARRRSSAAEAGVDTVEPYRGRGLAPLVVATWRRAVEDAGTEPLYSTAWVNHASLAVARKLRLIAYADTYSTS